MQLIGSYTKNEANQFRSRLFKKNPFGGTNLEKIRSMFTRHESELWMQTIADSFIDLILCLPDKFENEDEIILLLGIKHHDNLWGEMI